MKHILFFAFALITGVICRGQIITRFAGADTFSLYSGDGGPATAAMIDYPAGIAIDGIGNVYFSDGGNNRIRRIDTLGTIITYAGGTAYGFAGDGEMATTAELNNPSGLIFDTSGNLYIADSYNNRIRKVSTSGIITTVAGDGTAGFSGDGGAATDAKLNNPVGVAFDANGNLYIVDNSNSRIRRVNTSGVITTFAGNGSNSYGGDGGAATDAAFSNPQGIAIDAGGNLFIADYNNNIVRRIDSSGVISTFAGYPPSSYYLGVAGYSGDGGPATLAQLNNPMGLAFDASGDLYIADNQNACIRMVNTHGLISTSVGRGTFISPVGVAISGAGHIFVTDAGNNEVNEIAGRVDTLAGTGFISSDYASDGIMASVAEITQLSGLAVDAHGNVYISTDNTRIRKINTAGTISTFAGIFGYEGDDGEDVPAIGAGLGQPEGIAFDGIGNLYFADNNNAIVRKIDTAGIITSFIGGTWHYARGYSGDGGPATEAELNSPWGVAADDVGNVYVADNVNNNIRKVDTAGIITTFAGNGLYGYSADGGPATAAELNGVGYVFVDNKGNVYFADGTYRIRKVDTSGIITTFAGTGTAGFSGDGGPATAAEVEPSGIGVFDKFGNAYIDNNNRIRRIDTSGIITTVAGNGIAGYSGDQGPATAAELEDLVGIGIDSSGRIYLADGIRNIVRIMELGLRTITGGSSVCAGTTFTLTDSSLGGTWSSSDTTIATVGSSSGVVTGVAAGNVIITYSDSGWYVLHNLTVNPLPVSGIITGTASLCGSGATTSLSDTVSGGVWSSTDTTMATISDSGVVTGFAAGTSLISYSVTNSCGTAAATKIITVDSIPNAGTITGITTVCAGGATTLLTDSVSGGTWSSATSASATISDSGVVTGVATGTSLISYTITNSCGATAATAIITVNPMPNAGSIAGTTEVCPTATVVLTDTVPGGSWTCSNTHATITGDTVRGEFGGLDTINYSITNSCGTATTSIIITVAPLPEAGVISGADSVCQGMVDSLTESVPGGAWSVTNANATVTDGVVAGVSPGLDTIQYTVATTCAIVSNHKTVFVNPLPNAGAIIGIVAACPGISFSLLETAGGGFWSLSNSNVSIASTDSSGISLSTITSGLDTVHYFVSNVCGTATANSVITVNQVPIFNVTNNGDSLCPMSTIPDTLKLYCNPDSLGETFSWLGPDGFTSTVQNPFVIAAPFHMLDTGVYSVRVANSFGCRDSGMTRVRTMPPLIIPHISGIHHYCTGDTFVPLGITMMLGAHPLWFMNSAGGIGDSIAPTINTLIAGTETIYAAQVFGVCVGSRDSFTVVVDTTPPPPASLSGFTICAGSTITLTDGLAGGYWNCDPRYASISDSGYLNADSIATDIVTYTMSSGCYSTVSITVNAVPDASTISIVGADTTGSTNNICLGASYLLNATLNGGTWVTTSPGILNIAGDTLTGIGSGIGTIKYTLTSPGCSNAITTMNVAVADTPTSMSITTRSFECVGHRDTAGVMIGSPPGGIWTISDTTLARITADGSDSATLFALNAPGIVVVRYTINNMCGTFTTSTNVSLFTSWQCDSILFIGGMVKQMPDNNKDQLMVYPNPNIGAFTVEIPMQNGNKSIILMDIYGKVVDSRLITDDRINQTDFNITTLANGTYIIKVVTDTGIFEAKVVKME